MFEEWEKKYEAIHPPDLSTKSILCAYNLCLDKIKHIEEIPWVSPHNHVPAFLKTMDDVYGAICHCMKNGIGYELPFSDEMLKREIESLGFEEVRLGGQVGIMANIAALLNAEVIVHPIGISSDVARLLDSRILVPQDTQLIPAGKSRFTRALPHYIFEFKRGVSPNGIDIPRDNRFIASFIPDTMECSDDFEEMLPALAHRTQHSIISGFHLIPSTSGDEIVKNQIARIRAHMEILKENRIHRIHCEMAAMDKGVTSHLDDVFPLADSIGLNETELISLAQNYGYEARNDICSLFETMVFLKERLSLRRIHLHTLGNYLCLTEDATHERDALLLASLAAASRARRGEIRSLSQLEDSKGIPISPGGMDNLSTLSRHLDSSNLREEGIEGELVCVPTKIVPWPQSTVGLGDTISSAFFF